MVLKHPVSPQYIIQKKINVTILKVISPVNYILKESPGVDSSLEAINFTEAEESMQKYYELLEQSFLQIPSKNTVVVVLYKSKFYRAKVISIISQTTGYSFKVYLLDYGEECFVPSNCIYEIEKDFLIYPFQAVSFKLLGIEPVSLVLNNIDLTVSYGPVSEWDLSCDKFINSCIKEMHNAYIEVKGFDQKNIYGNLYLSLSDGTVKCLNDELIANKFARFNEANVQGITKVSEIEINKSKTPVVSKSVSPGKNTTPKSLEMSSNKKNDFDAFKISFIRPTDGKLVAESTFIDDEFQCLPNELGPKQDVESVEKPVPVQPVMSSKSSNLLQKLKELKQKSTNKSHELCDNVHISSIDNKLCSTKQSKLVNNTSCDKDINIPVECGVKSDENARVLSSLNTLDISSIPCQNFPKQKSPVLSPGAVSQTQKLIQGLQKLKVKKESISGSHSDLKQGAVKVQMCDDPSLSVNSKMLCSPNHSTTSSLSPKSLPVEVTSNLSRSDGIPVCDEENNNIPCNMKAEKVYAQIVNNLNTSNVSIYNSLENHPKSKSPSFPSGNTSQSQKLLQKLQNLKMKKVSTLVSQTGSKLGAAENNTLANTSPSVNNDSPLSNTSQTALSPQPVKDLNTSLDSAVSCKKLDAFFQRKKQGMSSSSGAKATDNCDKTFPNNFALVPKEIDQSLKNSPLRKLTFPEPEEGNFVHSSPIIARKINFSPAGAESTPNVAKSSVAAVKHHKVSKHEKSFNETSSDSNNSKSHILKETSSDSEDIFFSTLTKQNESFSSDKSDIEDLLVDLSAKLDDSNPRQLIDFQSSSLWEKQKVPVLQIGTGVPLPVLSIEEAEFSTNLQKVLKEIKFLGPSCIQSVVWPSMARNCSLIAIAPPHSGKTVSYVLPLVSTFTDDEIPLPKGTGPIVVILCSSWRKAHAVNDYFDIFKGDSKLKIITITTNDSSLKHRVLTLINSCDVLISTPFCLLQCFKDKLINLSRCSRFILDDGTTLITRQKIEVRDILLHYIDVFKHKEVRPQIVVCAERWNADFNIILDKFMSTPLLFFTSFLESAIYAQIQFKCHLSEDSEKKKLLPSIIGDAVKVVICTTNKEDATDIHHFLRCEDVRTYLVTEEMEHYIADEVIKDWKAARSMTAAHSLVITDQALVDMCISNADSLIHYDIPHDSRLQFGNRFSCIAENFQDKEKSKKCVCHVLVTEKDSKYASHLIEILENSGGKAPKELKNLSKSKHMFQKGTPLTSLCKHFKALGFCRQIKCEYRHYINPDLDKPSVVPYEGDVLGVVTHIVDASHYYVRLLKYLTPGTNEIIALNASYARIAFKLREFYANMAQELMIDMPVIGETYVLAEGDDLFYRIKVLEEVAPKTSQNPKWKVLFVDEGWIKYIEKLKIFNISVDIDLPSPIAVEIYLCNVKTPDACLNWNPRTNFLVSELIKGKEIHGKIVLCLGDTLWLDPVVQRKHFGDKNDYINVMKLDKQLIDWGHAKENKMHLATLQKACENKVKLPHIIKPSSKKEADKKIGEFQVSFAFLECDIEEDVYVSSVISPHHFYVQRAKFGDCLDNLLDKINTEIENKTLKRIFSFYKNMQCIGPFHEDNRYYRAIVTEIIDDEKVELFYTDFGDSGRASKNDIFALPQEFTLLPFQAIECELFGISAAHGGWSESVSDMLYNLTRDEAGDMKILLLKAHYKTISYRGGNRYVVDLEYENKSLSQQLIEAGFGVPAEVPSASPSNDECGEDISKQLDHEAPDSKDATASDEDEKKEGTKFVSYILTRLMENYDRIAPVSAGATVTEVVSDGENSVPQCYQRTLKADDKEVNSIKPLITWWNTPQELSVLINLKNIKVYELSVTDEGFSFNTITAGIQYSTDETFYEKIHSKTAAIYQTHEGINIASKKQVPHKWPRLIVDKAKFLHIKYDLIHINDSDSDEFSCDMNKNYQETREFGYVDKLKESTDEDEHYVEPWKNIGNPYKSLE